jgi:putative hydrolase of the HAD superfamily
MLEFPNLVILDLDNTIYNYGIANRAGMSQLVDFIFNTLRLERNQIELELDLARDRVKKRLGPVASAHSRLLYVRDFLTFKQINIRKSFALECEQVYWRAYIQSMIPYDGVLEFVSKVRLNGAKLALVTDLTSAIQLRKLIWLGLDDIFDIVVTSEEAGGDKVSGKPALHLREAVGENPGIIWCVGDANVDYLFPSKSLFFKKLEIGELRVISETEFEFSDFRDLLNILSVS